MPSTLAKQSAAVFSSALFRPLIVGKVAERLNTTVSDLRMRLSIPDSASNSTVLEAAYQVLVNNYRSEYYYKNVIASRILIERHRASKVALLNECKIGNAIADCVVINGRGMVYEIKTEFDSPSKLGGQIRNYYGAFPYVTVVTDSKATDRYLKLVEGTPVGLTSVSARGVLASIKPAAFEPTLLDVATIFNVLRVSEVTAILRSWYGDIPTFPNGIRYSELLSLAKQIPVNLFQGFMQDALKSRGPRNCRQLLLSKDEGLLPLRAIVSTLDPNARQSENLTTWLTAAGG